MHFRSIVGWATLAACVAGPALAAGSAEVRYQQPERFIDAGETPLDRDANLRLLTEQLQSLAAQKLPADQTLQVEVLDVDLAGYVRHTQRGDVRVVRDDNDSARIRLRYTLVSNGQALRSGEATLSDLASRGSLTLRREPGTLGREKALLASWFTKEFGTAHAAAN